MNATHINYKFTDFSRKPVWRKDNMLRWWWNIRHCYFSYYNI